MGSRNTGRRNLDRRLAALRGAAGLERPPRGWIRAMRDALGMTAAQLAARLGVSQPRVAAMEKAEALDAVTLATLRQAAEAMGCRLVYAFVPDRPLEETVTARARAVADARLARTVRTMALEGQAPADDDLAAERERLVAELLAGNPRRLWDDA